MLAFFSNLVKFKSLVSIVISMFFLHWYEYPSFQFPIGVVGASLYMMSIFFLPCPSDWSGFSSYMIRLICRVKIGTLDCFVSPYPGPYPNLVSTPTNVFPNHVV
jgi:hypothetical protein